MSSSQSIKVLRPLKGGIVHEDFGISSNDDTIQSENKLIMSITLLQQELKKQTVFSFIALLAAYATVIYVVGHWKIK